MLTAVLVSCGVVFVAELGDKSQLTTMSYALRYRWWVVLTGVAIAALMVHGLSVTIGHFLGMTLAGTPDRVRRRRRVPAVRHLELAGGKGRPGSSWPTGWPSRWGPCCTGSFRSASCMARPACCSPSSACGCSSTPRWVGAPSRSS
jgi:hypothetical protein